MVRAYLSAGDEIPVPRRAFSKDINIKGLETPHYLKLPFLCNLVFQLQHASSCSAFFRITVQVLISTPLPQSPAMSWQGTAKTTPLRAGRRPS